MIVSVVGLWRAAPDPLKRYSAAALRWLPNLPNSLKRRAVKNELEGELNAAFSQFGREGAGFIEHQIRIAWLTPDEDVADSFFREGKAYLKLNFSENNERNLVEAALLYCTDGYLLPTTRQHLPKPLMRAIDLTFIDELLERRNAIHSRGYFTQEVLPRELAASPETEKYMDTLGLISQHGLFIRVLLPELRDYAGHVAQRLARQQHKEQIEAFIEFLGTTSRDRETKTQTGLLHVGATIRTGIVLVGIPGKLESEGNRPYVRRSAINADRGARTVYLVGYNRGVEYVPRIAKEAQRRGIVNSYETHQYNALVRGDVTKQVVARLSIIEGAGSRFLQTYPNMLEWPDLEDELAEDDAVPAQLL